MQQTPPSPSSPRAVSPLGIIASDLRLLDARATDMAAVDFDFRMRLARTAALADGLEPYLAACSTPASTVLTDLAADTARLDWTRLHATGLTAIPLEMEMLSGHLEGRLLNFLVRTARATRVLEIGLFTGYSALAMAEALPADGTLVACEIDPYAAGVARHWFDRSAHGRKISIEIGPALRTLERLREAGRSFDFVFIDADKPSYIAYYDALVGSSLLDDGGVVCVDNTLMQGEPYLSGPRTANGRAIAEFNERVASDPRVEQVLLPIRDGLTLIRRVSS